MKIRTSEVREVLVYSQDQSIDSAMIKISTFTRQGMRDGELATEINKNEAQKIALELCRIFDFEIKRTEPKFTAV